MCPLLILCHHFICINAAQAQSTDPLVSIISLEDLSTFQNAPRHWRIVGNVFYDLKDENIIKEEKGTGVLIYNPKDNDNQPILTNVEHGDMDLEFDFMMPKGSISAVYLQGSYGIRLNDSWDQTNSIAEASGAIYQPIEGNKPVAPIIPPRYDVCKAPGLWQNLKIFFQAPKFDGTGKKISNAKFAKVVYNGVLIHENIEVPEAGSHSHPGYENPLGTLTFSSDDGIAIRNIRYKIAASSLHPASSLVPTMERPIIVEPGKRTMVQRCFMANGLQKRTFCVAVGEPEQIHYAMDLSLGAVISVWKGSFLDVTTMWTGRGEKQLARPLGSTIELSSGPTVALLKNKDETWPDTILERNNYQFKGYRLDKQNRPIFKYIIHGVAIEDRIIPENNVQYLTRTLTVNDKGNTKNLWFRLVKGSQIKLLPNGLYSIDNSSYYIGIKSKNKYPLIRKGPDGEELLVPVVLNEGQAQLSYSIIW